MEAALRAAFDEYRQSRAAELYELAALLQEFGITPDSSPLGTAAGQCLAALRRAGAHQPDSGRDYWGYELTDLAIRLPVQRHYRPRGARMEETTGYLSVTVHEYPPSSLAEVGSAYALIRQLQADFYFDAFMEDGGARHQLRACWHFDTHMYSEGRTHAVHPRFHLQVGGERLDELDGQIRGVFVPEAPRLPACPLDAPLAVDFVLSHYSGADWYILRSDEPRYNRLNRGPMARLWRPYYSAIADLLAGPGGEAADHPTMLLLPNLI